MDDLTLQKNIEDARRRKVPESLIQARVAEIKAQKTPAPQPQVTAPAPTNMIANQLPTQSIDPEAEVRGSFLSNIGNKVIDFGKGVGSAIAQAPKRLGEGLGEGINLATGGNQRNQEEVDAALEQVNITSQRAADEMRAGNTQAANRLFELAKKQNERARNLAKSKTKEIVDVEKDIVKGGAGTAAFFVPGGTTFGSAVASGVTSGALSGYGASDDTNELSSTLGGAALGGTAAGAAYGVSKYLSPKKIATKLETAGDKTRALAQTPVRTGNDVYAPARDKGIEETLRKNGITGSSAERFAKLQPKIAELSDEARTIIKADPKPVQYKQVEEGLMKNLAPNMRSKGIDAPTAKMELQGYIDDLFSSTGDDQLKAAVTQLAPDGRPMHQKMIEEAANKGDFATVGRILDAIPEDDTYKKPMEIFFRDKVPTNYKIPKDLNTLNIDDLRKMVNKDYRGIRAKLKRGTVPLNARETTIAGLKNTFDDIIKQNHPDARELIIQENKLYNAAPSLAKGRSNPPTLRAAGFSIPRAWEEKGANAAGATISAPGKLIGKLPEIPPQTASYLGGKSPMLFNNQSQDAPIDSGMTTDGVPMSSQSSQLPPISTIPEEKTLSGYTPEKLYSAYMQALGANDKATAAQLRQMYEDEMEYAKANKAGSGKPKSSAALLVESKAKAGTDAIRTLMNEIQKNPQIALQAQVPGAPGARIYSAAMSSLTDALGGLRTGATVSDTQRKFYEAMTPMPFDSVETLLYKFNALQNEMNNNLQGAADIEDPLTAGQLPPITN